MIKDEDIDRTEKPRVQFFLDKTPNGWRIVGYLIDDKHPYNEHYWENSHYKYVGKMVDAHVLLRASVYPPIKYVLKMVSQYMEKHISFEDFL